MQRRRSGTPTCRGSRRRSDTRAFAAASRCWPARSSCRIAASCSETHQRAYLATSAKASSRTCSRRSTICALPESSRPHSLPGKASGCVAAAPNSLRHASVPSIMSAACSTSQSRASKKRRSRWRESGAVSVSGTPHKLSSCSAVDRSLAWSRSICSSSAARRVNLKCSRSCLRAASRGLEAAASKGSCACCRTVDATLSTSFAKVGAHARYGLLNRASAHPPTQLAALRRRSPTTDLLRRGRAASAPRRRRLWPRRGPNAPSPPDMKGHAGGAAPAAAAVRRRECTRRGAREPSGGAHRERAPSPGARRDASSSWPYTGTSKACVQRIAATRAGVSRRRRRRTRRPAGARA